METPNLYPLSIGEILDRAFRLYRRHFGLLIGITLVGYVPMTVLQIISQLRYGTIRGINNILTNFFVLFVSGALIVACANLYLGKSITVGYVYRAILKRYGSVLGGFLVTGLLVILPALLIILPVFFFFNLFSDSFLYSGLTTIITILVGMPLLIFLTTRWNLLIPSIMLEGCKAGEGLTRSWNLTQGFFWHVFNTTFLASLLVIILGTLPRWIIWYGLNMILPDSPFNPFMNIILSQIALIFAYPLSQSVTVILYYDLLVRKEGFDLALQLNNDSPQTLFEKPSEKEEPYDYVNNPW